jgi:hypothetical protein
VAFTYVGICAGAAVYYLLLETHVYLQLIREANTAAWYQTVPNSRPRHAIRDVGEGLLGRLLAIAFTYNHYRRIGKKTIFDRLEITLRIPNLKSGHKLAGGG